MQEKTFFKKLLNQNVNNNLHQSLILWAGNPWAWATEVCLRTAVHFWSHRAAELSLLFKVFAAVVP